MVVMVHWLFFENFYPSLTLGALYVFWRVSADTKTCGSPQNYRLLAVYVSLPANIRVF